ncbi:probable galactinol--sucrose galactosyltransferase 2 [Ziziphus jujuba]|uniref:galactinol--sucrose galactosyltransferase n=1 Tax=Ziziphus jujuba TaxID=326968 RepID=A0ABM3IJL3_ZIZJJ|nr:probable galactinol--sucrose galactosyltransferase 2 [Ziziphus jujuba]
MTISTTPSVGNGSLMIRGKAVLTGVPDNVIVTPAGSEAAFIGASSENSSSCHVFSLRILQGYRFTCLFRFKLWWMIPCFGELGGQVPAETQMLLLEVRDKSSVHEEITSNTEPNGGGETFYVLLLPILDGQFRASLQGTVTNELELNVESGDPNVETSLVMETVFMNSGGNPYNVLKDSIKMLANIKGTFNHIENKKVPEHVDWFGWSTWDAFYTRVTPEGIEEGLKSYADGGFAPKFLIIDDGWQNTIEELYEDDEEIPVKHTFVGRLVSLDENRKFKNFYSLQTICTNLQQFIKILKEKYAVRMIYTWHALVGYWGGVLPRSKVMRKYNPRLEFPMPSRSNVSHVICDTLVNVGKYGVGLIDPSKILSFYDDLHSYLASCGVDGVKVDVQNIVEMLGSGYGGRVEFSRQYQQALEESVDKNFKANNLISCMSLNTEYIYSSKVGAVARVSEDFMPNEPTFQTLHVAAVAFNSLLLGEIVVPDWDQFYSDHYTAYFHGAARALGGCSIYVSDRPGKHDFEVIKKLVLPDGSILRARKAGRPTRDCLFSDPVIDGKSLLKIWNVNNLTGIIGIFNCQRAGKWPPTPGAQYESPQGSADVLLSSRVSPSDVDSLEEIADEHWNGDCALYSFGSGSLSKMPRKGSFEVSLGTLKCEIYTVSPIRVFGDNIQFAPLGLVDMFNSGGAIKSLDCKKDSSGLMMAKIQVRGCGRFGAYSHRKPRSCAVDKKEKQFIYDAKEGLLTFKLDGDCNYKEIQIVY